MLRDGSGIGSTAKKGHRGRGSTPKAAEKLLPHHWATAGLDVHYEQTKHILPANQKSYDNSETTVEKLSARRIQVFRVPFSMIIF